jgi:sugar lactone lactonase YvrE
MDGKNRITLIKDNLGWPNGITVDKATRRIIWNDANTEVIESADFLGNNRKLLVNGVLHPYGLTVAGDFIYWTDWAQKGLQRANKDTGEGVEVVRDQMPRLMDVRAIEIGETGTQKRLFVIMVIDSVLFRCGSLRIQQWGMQPFVSP